MMAEGLYAALAVVGMLLTAFVVIQLLVRGFIGIEEHLPHVGWEAFTRLRVLIPVLLVLGGILFFLGPRESNAEPLPPAMDCCSCCCEQDLSKCAVATTGASCPSSAVSN